MTTRFLSTVLALTLACAPVQTVAAPSTVKLRGYITARPDAQTLQILADDIHLQPSTHLEIQNPETGSLGKLQLESLVPGILIEAEGRWTERHQFLAEKITCDASQFDRTIKEHAYVQTEPANESALIAGKNARLEVDGEILQLDGQTEREWHRQAPSVSSISDKPETQTGLLGRQVRYAGIRQADGTIAAVRVELGPPAPADAYKMPGGLAVVQTSDPQTKIPILEFRKGEKVRGRVKLFDVKEVQEYVSRLGLSLLPPANNVTARTLEFRFFVVEDPQINAAALPDGTILVNTGLLGAMENESQLAFVLSHEIAHVLQAHYWREVNETRAKRVALLVAGVAGTVFVGSIALFLSELGMAAVVNGYSRRIENQADRLGMQNVIDHGYDPRQAEGTFRTFIDHYGNRSTSALWSNHDSSVLRGSFLHVQLAREYPQGHFDGAVVNTAQFQSMEEAMGPVKIM